MQSAIAALRKPAQLRRMFEDLRPALGQLLLSRRAGLGFLTQRRPQRSGGGSAIDSLAASGVADADAKAAAAAAAGVSGGSVANRNVLPHDFDAKVGPQGCLATSCLAEGG